MKTSRDDKNQMPNETTMRALHAFVKAAGNTDPLTSFMTELARNVPDAAYQTTLHQAQIPNRCIMSHDGQVLAQVIHSGNNQIIEVLDKRLFGTNDLEIKTPAIIQISSQKTSTQQAKQQLPQKWKPYHFIANETTSLHASIPDPSDQSNDPMNYILTVMENAQCTLLTTHNFIPDNQRIDFAISICVQLSRLLTDLRLSGLLWTDMKPGNILFRQRESDNQLELFISDPKGLVSASELKIGKTSVDKKEFIRLEDITPIYHSAMFNNAMRQNDISTRQQAAEMVEDEYSYQLAILLYTAVTGNEPANFDKPLIFDFAQPIFNVPDNDQVRNLKTLIESLSGENPNTRLHHSQAIKLIHSLKLSPEAFNTKLQAATQQRAQSPTPIPEINPQPPNPTLKHHYSTGDITEFMNKNPVKSRSPLRKIKDRLSKSDNEEKRTQQKSKQISLSEEPAEKPQPETPTFRKPH